MKNPDYEPNKVPQAILERVGLPESEAKKIINANKSRIIGAAYSTSEGWRLFQYGIGKIIPPSLNICKRYDNCIVDNVFNHRNVKLMRQNSSGNKIKAVSEYISDGDDNNSYTEFKNNISSLSKEKWAIVAKNLEWDANDIKTTIENDNYVRENARAIKILALFYAQECFNSDDKSFEEKLKREYNGHNDAVVGIRPPKAIEQPVQETSPEPMKYWEELWLPHDEMEMLYQFFRWELPDSKIAAFCKEIGIDEVANLLIVRRCINDRIAMNQESFENAKKVLKHLRSVREQERSKEREELRKEVKDEVREEVKDEVREELRKEDEDKRSKAIEELCKEIEEIENKSRKEIEDRVQKFKQLFGQPTAALTTALSYSLNESTPDVIATKEKSPIKRLKKVDEFFDEKFRVGPVWTTIKDLVWEYGAWCEARNLVTEYRFTKGRNLNPGTGTRMRQKLLDYCARNNLKCHVNNNVALHDGKCKRWIREE